MNVEIVAKSHKSYFVFDKKGNYCGFIEPLGSDWCFFPREGLAGPRYAFGFCPVESLERWVAGGGVFNGS